MRNYNQYQRSFDRTPGRLVDYPGNREVRFPHSDLTPAFTNLLLRDLSILSLRRLQPHIKRVSLSGGESISRPDEVIDWIYFPESTAISELQILEDGRTIEVLMTGNEGAVGLSSLLLPIRSSNWVQASLPGTVIKIKREELQHAIGENAKTTDAIHRVIQSQMKQLAQKVACSAHHAVEGRFSTWLLMLRDRSSANRLKLTQEQIARVLGVYRPSVTCIAQSLRDAGLIDYVRGNIVITDRNGLEKRGCGCYSPVTSAMDTLVPNPKGETADVF